MRVYHEMIDQRKFRTRYCPLYVAAKKE